MPHIPGGRRLGSELASAMEEATLAMLLNPDSESEDDYYDLLSILALAHDAASYSRHLNRGTRGSAGRLPIEGVTAEYLTYPDRSFVVDSRMHRDSFWVPSVSKATAEGGGSRSVSTVVTGSAAPIASSLQK